MKATLRDRLMSVVRRCWPWAEIRTLRVANERLIQAMSDPVLTGVHIGNGSLDVGMKEFAGAELLAGMFLGVFEKHPEATNYMEWRFSSRLGDVAVIAVRQNGLSPDQLRRAAEQENDRLRARLAELGGWEGQA